MEKSLTSYSNNTVTELYLQIVTYKIGILNHIAAASEVNITWGPAALFWEPHNTISSGKPTDTEQPRLRSQAVILESQRMPKRRRTPPRRRTQLSSQLICATRRAGLTNGTLAGPAWLQTTFTTRTRST